MLLEECQPFPPCMRMTKMESQRREGSLRLKTKGSFDSNDFLMLIIGNLLNNEKRLKITKNAGNVKFRLHCGETLQKVSQKMNAWIDQNQLF